MDIRLYFHHLLLSTFGESAAGSEHSLELNALCDKFALQSGRCGVSALKLILEDGRLNSARLAKRDVDGPWAITNVMFVSALVEKLSDEFHKDYKSIVGIIRDINSDMTKIPPEKLFDPRVQASMHLEYLLENEGFIVTRSGEIWFNVAEPGNPNHIMIASYSDVISLRIPIRISSEYTTTSSINSALPINQNIGFTGFSGSYTVTGPVTFTVPTFNPFMFNPLVPVDYTYQTTAGVDREEIEVKIPLSDPNLFSKVVQHVKRLLSESRNSPDA